MWMYKNRIDPAIDVMLRGVILHARMRPEGSPPGVV